MSQDFFELTGLPLLQGRAWTDEEDVPQGPLVAAVTEQFWRNELNGDEGVLGRPIQLNQSSYVIVGIVPSGFRLGTIRDPEIFLPLQAKQTSRFGGPVMTVGRRLPNVSLDVAKAEMETVMAGIRAESPQDGNTGVLLTPLQDWVIGDMRVILLAVLGSVACVWLIGCANLSNMQLARSAARVKELALRVGLGAGRMRLFRQVLTETTVTAFLGGAIGLPLAWGVLQILPAIESTYIPRVEEMHLSSVGIAIAAIATLLSGLMIGVAPALQAGRRSLNVALSGGGALLGQSGGRLRSILVVSQLALSVMLLAGAGLLCNSFLRLLNVDLGFDRTNVVAIEPRHYELLETEKAVRFLSELQNAVNRMPGVESTSLAHILPLDSQMAADVRLSANLEQNPPQEAQLRQVAPDYFATFRIPLVAGRDLEVGDERRWPVPTVLSRQAALLLYGDQDPLGRRFFNGVYGEFSEMEVVGVVGEVRQRGIAMESPPIVYMPVGLRFAPKYVVARLAPGAPLPADAIRKALRDMDASITVEISTMEGRFDEETGETRFFFWLIGGFALAGLVMAAVGIYGVTSYAVAQRRREFAIRIALGARDRQILWNAVRSAFLAAMAGMALGLVGAFATTDVLQSVLYGVRPDDPATLVMAAVLLAAISLATAILAGLEATNINPATALKQE